MGHFWSQIHLISCFLPPPTSPLGVWSWVLELATWKRLHCPQAHGGRSSLQRIFALTEAWAPQQKAVSLGTKRPQSLWSLG